MQRISRLAGVVALMLTLGCDNHLPSDNLAPVDKLGPVQAAIMDGSTGGEAYFRFVPPTIGTAPLLPTVNDKRLFPEAHICELTSAGSCGPVVFSFGRNLKQANNLKVANFFEAEWPTAVSNVDASKNYRINVTLDGNVIGYIDADVVNTAAELNSVDRNNYVGVVKGSKLAIAFWMKSGLFSYIDAKTGGTALILNGLVKVEVPKGATPNVHIRIEPASPPNVAGAIIVPNTYYEFGPANLQFSKPAEIRLMLDPKWIPNTIQPNELKLLRFKDGVWSEVAGASVELHKNLVRGAIDGFSGYGLGKLTGPVTPPPVRADHLTAPAMPGSVLVNTPVSVEVVAVDVQGNPVSVTTPFFAIANGPNGPVALGSATPVNGRATFNLTFAQPGYNNTVTFTADAITSHTTNAFTVAEIPGMPTGLHVVNQSTTGFDLSYDVAPIFGSTKVVEPFG
jgi:hypothetical protein